MTLALSAILASALPALADDNSTTNQQQNLSSEQSGDQLKVSDEEMNQQVKDANKASKLIGMQVKNKQDEDLGKIKDIVIDLQQGKVAYAVLSVGGTLGFGSRNVAVPINALRIAQGEKSLLIDLPKQQVASAPGFSDEQWPHLDAAKTGQTIGLAQSPSHSAQGGTSSDEHTTTGTTSPTDSVSGSSSDTNSLGGTSDTGNSTSGRESGASDTNSPSNSPTDSSDSDTE